jgi:hypothetical protein
MGEKKSILIFFSLNMFGTSISEDAGAHSEHGVPTRCDIGAMTVDRSRESDQDHIQYGAHSRPLS